MEALSFLTIYDREASLMCNNVIYLFIFFNLNVLENLIMLNY